jgi:hypothetical protein
MLNVYSKILSIFKKFIHIENSDKDWWELSENDNYRGEYIFIKAKKNKKFKDYRPQ